MPVRLSKPVRGYFRILSELLLLELIEAQQVPPRHAKIVREMQRQMLPTLKRRGYWPHCAQRGK